MSTGFQEYCKFMPKFNTTIAVMLFCTYLLAVISCQGDKQKTVEKDNVNEATAPISKSEKSASTDEKSKGKFYGVKPTEYPSWFKESFKDFKQDVSEAKAADKRVMMIFHQNGCPYCNALIKRNFSQKDIEQQVKKHFDVITLNMWGDLDVIAIDGKKYTEKTFAESLKVQFTPTVLFFDELGKIILRLNGYRPPRYFKTALNYIAEHKEKEIDYRSYAKANLPPGEKGEMNAEDFFSSPPYDLSIKSGENLPFQAVFFEQKDCPNCNYLHKDVLPDADTRTIIKQFKNIQLDMWSKTPVVTPAGKQTTANEWAKELDIKYAPSIVVFDQSGKEIIRSEAFFKVFHTQSIFAYVLEGADKKQPSFQRYLSERAEHIADQGKDVDIWRLAGEKPSERE